MPKWKKKYRKKRKEFKQKLYELAKDNKVYLPMIFETYSAYRHREHIHRIWSLMLEYPDFRAKYNDELMGKMLCGRDEILFNLHYIDNSFLEYRKSIPERLAMGDALAIAYRVQAENKQKNNQ